MQKDNKHHSLKNTDRNAFSNVVLYALLAIATVFAFLQIVNIGKKFETRSKAQISPVRLYLNPGASTLPPNRSVKMMMDTKNEKIVFVQAGITFDQTKVALTNEISTTSKMRTILRKTTMSQANSTGRAVVILGLAAVDRANPPSGIFELANFSFTPKVAGPTTVDVTIDTAGMQVVNWDASEMVTQTSNAKLTLNPSTVQPTNLPTQAVAATRAPTNVIAQQTPTVGIDPTAAVSPTPMNSFGGTIPTPLDGEEPTEGELIPVPSPEPLGVEGDVNGDGCVNFADIRSCLNVFVPFVKHSCDANADKKSNVSDFFYVLARLGNGCSK